MKDFLVNIYAYDHHGRFKIKSEDNPHSLEKAILDKVGEKSIVWEYTGDMYDSRVKRITYMEVVNGTRPVQTKTVLGVEVAVGV